MKKFLLTMLAAWLPLIGGASAAAADYHAGDVEAVNNILRVNDAENGRLAREGWVIGRPETWPVRPLPDEDRFASAVPTRQERPSTKFKRWGVTWSDDGRLTGLFLNGKRLSGSLEAGGLSELKVLRIDHNSLTAVTGLDGLTNLVELEAHNNRLTGIGRLDGLTRLRSINIARNRLTDIGDLGGLTDLRWLQAGRNRLTDIGRLGGLTELLCLDVGDGGPVSPDDSADLGNRLTDIGDLSGLTNLRWLKISGNRLTDIGDLGGLTGLAELEAAGNQLRSLGRLDRLSALVQMDVSGNRLTKLEGLSSAAKLRALYLGGNSLEGEALLKNIPIGQLTSFGFSGGQFPEFSLKRGFEKVTALRISGGAELRSVDLDRRTLSFLSLDDRIDAAKFNDPGTVAFISISEDHHYRLTELRALFDKFTLPDEKEPEILLSRPQTVTLGDAAGLKGFKADRRYSLAELSPLLADEYAACWRRYRQVFVHDRKDGRPSTPDQIDPDNGGDEPRGHQAFNDKDITFPGPGEYYLTVVGALSHTSRKSVAVIHYDDVFIIEE